MAVGRVLRPHGVRGELVIQAYSELIRSLEPSSEVFLEDRPIALISIRPHREKYLIRLEGCSNRTEAEHFRDQEIQIAFADAEDLPDGTYFYWQIIGLQVFAESGEGLGQISEIIETGANDVYLVKQQSGGEILIPAIEDVILEVDLENGRMKVHILPGMLE